MPKSKQQKQKEALVRWEKELKNLKQELSKLNEFGSALDGVALPLINDYKTAIERKKKQINDLTAKLDN